MLVCLFDQCVVLLQLLTRADLPRHMSPESAGTTIRRRHSFRGTDCLYRSAKTTITVRFNGSNSQNGYMFPLSRKTLLHSRCMQPVREFAGRFLALSHFEKPGVPNWINKKAWPCGFDIAQAAHIYTGHAIMCYIRQLPRQQFPKMCIPGKVS